MQCILKALKSPALRNLFHSAFFKLLSPETLASVSHPSHLWQSTLWQTQLSTERTLYQVGLGEFRARPSLPGTTAAASSGQDPIITNLASSRFIPLPPVYPPCLSKHKSVQATYFLKIHTGLPLPLGLCPNSLAGTHFGSNLNAQPLPIVFPYPVYILLFPNYCGSLHSSVFLLKCLEGPLLPRPTPTQTESPA